MTAQQAGAGGIIRAPRAPGSGFDIVPHARSRDTRLSFRARAILERLLSNADGFSMTSIDVARESPSEGRGAILLALRELRQVGYLVTERSQGSDGRWRTKNVIYDTPQGEAESAEVALPDLGLPDSGPPASGNATLKAEVPLRNTKKQEHAGARAAAGEDQEQGQSGQKKGTVIHGVQCWTHDDRQEVERLVEAHGEDNVRGAADAVQASGKKPLPSLVSAAIQAMTTALREQERRRADDFHRADELRRWQAAQAAPPSPTGRAALEATAKALRVPLSTCDVDR